MNQCDNLLNEIDVVTETTYINNYIKNNQEEHARAISRIGEEDATTPPKLSRMDTYCAPPILDIHAGLSNIEERVSRLEASNREYMSSHKSDLYKHYVESFAIEDHESGILGETEFMKEVLRIPEMKRGEKHEHKRDGEDFTLEPSSKEEIERFCKRIESKSIESKRIESNKTPLQKVRPLSAQEVALFKEWYTQETETEEVIEETEVEETTGIFYSIVLWFMDKLGFKVKKD